MKNEHNVRVLDQKTNREDFTQHGLHLNATGKHKAVKQMYQNISRLFEGKKKQTIILKWRTTHGNPCREMTVPQAQPSNNLKDTNENENKEKIMHPRSPKGKEKNQHSETRIFYGQHNTGINS
jgi:hypothetical protein